MNVCLGFLVVLVVVVMRMILIHKGPCWPLRGQRVTLSLEVDDSNFYPDPVPVPVSIPTLFLFTQPLLRTFGSSPVHGIEEKISITLVSVC